MPETQPAVRLMADVDAPVAVFLVGMRINRLRSVRGWLPAARAMGPMLASCPPSRSWGSSVRGPTGRGGQSWS